MEMWYQANGNYSRNIIDGKDKIVLQFDATGNSKTLSDKLVDWS